MGTDLLRSFFSGVDVTHTYLETEEIAHILTHGCQLYTGTVTGTAGVALAVDTPGDPRVVIVVNQNTGTFGVKIYGMATTYAMKANSTGPALTYAANMITLGTGEFTVGVDGQLNTTHTLSYLALI